MKTQRPGLVNSVGRSLFRSLVRPTPIWVELFVTRRCNFNCLYCGAVDNSRPDPTLDELKCMALKIKSLGCRAIGLMGGEPTLRKDLVEFVEFCSINDILTELPTNGTLLLHKSRTRNGKSLLDRLVCAGLTLVNLSVDSVLTSSQSSEKRLPEVTDVLEALKRAKKESGLRVMLNCVITKHNLEEVPTLLEFCHQEGVTMAAIFAQDPYQFIDGKAVPESMRFSKADGPEVNRMADFLIAKKSLGYKLMDPVAYYESVKTWLAGDLEWRCGAGRNSFNVDIDGRLSICGYLPSLDLKIWDLDADYHRQLEPSREEHLPECSTKCLPTCMFSTEYYRRHPVQAVAKVGV